MVVEDKVAEALRIVEQAELQPGDVLLSRGCDRVAEIISHVDGSRYSHASIWSGEGVVEAVAEGLRHYSLFDSLTAHPRAFVHVFRPDRKTPTRERASELAVRAARAHPDYAWSELLLAGLMSAINPIPLPSDLRELTKLVFGDLAQLLDQWAPQIRGTMSRGKLGCMTCSQLIVTCFADAAVFTEDDPLRLKISGARFVRGDGQIPEPQGNGELEENLREIVRLVRPLLEAQVTAPTSGQRFDPPRESVVFAAHHPDAYPLHLVSPRDLYCSPDLKPLGRLDVEAILGRTGKAPGSLPAPGVPPADAPAPSPAARAESSATPTPSAAPTPRPVASSSRRRSRLLFLAASPRGLWPLNLAREHAAISEGLDSSKFGMELERLSPELQVGFDRLAHVIARHEPDVLHLSGHGQEGADGDPSLLLTLDFEDPQSVESRLLEGLLTQQIHPMRLLILNACNSAALAERLTRAVGCAIGMQGSVRDSAAAKFSRVFYQQVGNGYPVHFAFQVAKKAVESETWTPCLFDPGGQAESLFLVPRNDHQVEEPSASAVRGDAPATRSDAPPQVAARSGGGATEDSSAPRWPLDRPKTPRRETRRPYSSRGLLALLALAVLGLPLLISGAWKPFTQAHPVVALAPSGDGSAPPSVSEEKRPQPPAPTEPRPMGDPGLSIVAERSGKSIVIDSEHPFALGDLYGFYLEVDEPLYALVLQLSNDGKLQRLYPQGTPLRLIPGPQQRIPPTAEGDFEITSRSSDERLIVVLSESSLASTPLDNLAVWLQRHTDWPQGWTAGGLGVQPALASRDPAARQLRLRGSSFVPRTSRRQQKIDVAQVHFLEIAQR